MSAETQLGDHLRRIRKLEAVAAQAAVAGAQRPLMGHTAVQATLTTPKKWPGAMRVVPCYGFASSGSTVNDVGFAYRQLSDGQTAANFAAANDNVFATTDDFLLDSAIRYQCWIGVKVASNSATAHVGIETPSIGTQEVSLSGFPSAGYALVRLFADETIAAGEDIYVRMYRTASTGDITIDQLYFFPSNAFGNNTGPSGAMPANIASIQISTFADTGPTAAVDGADVHLGSALYDTQQVDDFNLTTRTGWSFLTQPLPYDVATYELSDDELRYGRHNYASARFKPTVSASYADGCFATLSNDGFPTATARVFSSSAGFYYLGPSNPYENPPQLTLWRNSTWGVDTVPYNTDDDGDADDVRVGVWFAITSYLDDYF